MVLSIFALLGFSERSGILSAAVWALLWIFYLSFVNAGQIFYGFGWEMLLLELGFLAIFLGPRGSEAPAAVIWLYRWVLFRVMFGAGLIKLRGDECWRNLTCMDYHYETQPLPNPLSWYFHHLPHAWHKLEVLSTHFIELIAPFAYFFPGPLAAAAGALTIAFHVMLILSGNLSWLNYATIAAALSCFDDSFWGRFKNLKSKMPEVRPLGTARKAVLACVTVLIGLLSLAPSLNLLSDSQMMNASFEPFHLVNTYGAFGSVTRERMEIVLEGTESENPENAVWREYEFKCKPGDVNRRPCVVSPYHYKLDWQIWFAAMSSYRYHPWLLLFTRKLLQNDRAALSLIANDPFPRLPPKYIRALLYRYRFTTPEEKKRTGAWWVRTLQSIYFPPVSLQDLPDDLFTSPQRVG